MAVPAFHRLRPTLGRDHRSHRALVAVGLEPRAARPSLLGLYRPAADHLVPVAAGRIHPGTAAEPGADRRSHAAHDGIDEVLAAVDHDRLLKDAGGRTLHL